MVVGRCGVDVGAPSNRTSSWSVIRHHECGHRMIVEREFSAHIATTIVHFL